MRHIKIKTTRKPRRHPIIGVITHLLAFSLGVVLTYLFLWSWITYLLIHSGMFI